MFYLLDIVLLFSLIALVVYILFITVVFKVSLGIFVHAFLIIAILLFIIWIIFRCCCCCCDNDDNTSGCCGHCGHYHDNDNGYS